MDLNTIERVRIVRDRAELADMPEGTAVIGGGSWVFSTPHDHLTELIDLQGFGWPALTVTDDGLSIAATCTLAELAAMPAPAPPVGPWPAHPLFYQCCTALYGSFKVWNVATVGGNIATSLPAGPMTSLGAALDADVILWRADGTDERMPVSEFVTGNTQNRLEHGDVLRSIEIPNSSLQAQTGYRKIALSPLGRSGAVLVARHDGDGSFTLTVSAATVRPEPLRFDRIPTAAELADAIGGIRTWFTDPHGAADWRRGVSGILGEQLRVELLERSDS
ncbi:FAD binding domain-containing protein [Microbacteriaceae bacterium VKM Ac-2855]|nr:FAD binding domain-containing protein [Microbacteriaceae bacterium VKM Ac-2855]